MTGIAALDGAFSGCGAADWGVASYGAVAAHMQPEARAKAEALCPGAAAVLVAAFPYYAGERPGNLSLYARGEDYHRAVIRRLESVCGALLKNFPAHRFVAGADSSPLPEKSAAWLAGLGLRGNHALLILPPYGSYVFLGTVLTDCVFDFSVQPAPDCTHCGRCVAACPSGALGPEGVDKLRCLSHLTQKKGELERWEAELVAAHPYAWGCDLCQRACPYNAAPKQTALAEFYADLLDDITPELLKEITQRVFREKYGDRAFSWRGPAVLRRNLTLQQQDF